MHVESWMVLLELFKCKFVPLQNVLLEQLFAHIEADQNDAWLLETVGDLRGPLPYTARRINDLETEWKLVLVVVCVKELQPN